MKDDLVLHNTALMCSARVIVMVLMYIVRVIVLGYLLQVALAHVRVFIVNRRLAAIS